MPKTIYNPLSGSYTIEGHEDLASYTDRNSARSAYRKKIKDEHKSIKTVQEYEQPHWKKK